MLSIPTARRFSGLVYLSIGKGEKLIECEVRWRNFNSVIGIRFTSNTSPHSLAALLDLCASKRLAGSINSRQPGG
jgi:hypothetical protein